MTPRWRRRLAGLSVVVMIPIWAGSHLWWARDEPQFVLWLSWAALVTNAMTIWATTDVRVEEEKLKDR